MCCQANLGTTLHKFSRLMKAEEDGDRDGLVTMPECGEMHKQQ